MSTIVPAAMNTLKSSRGGTALAKARRGLSLGCLLVVVASVYALGLGGGFAFDDFPNIVENAALRVEFSDGWSRWLAAMLSFPAGDVQRPLAMLSFALDHAVNGLDPWWMKFTNIALHVGNTGFVFALCRRLFRVLATRNGPGVESDRIALWVAAAWALNPINVTAVLLIVQRMEVLCHTFVLTGLWLYLVARMREREVQGGRGFGWSMFALTGATAIGVLSKESAALLPLYALALEWIAFGFCRADGRLEGRVIGSFAVLITIPAALGLSWLLPRVLGDGAYASRDFSLAERLLTEGRVLVDYVQWTAWPRLSQLGLFHDDYSVSRTWFAPPSTVASMALLVGMAVAIPLVRHQRPVIALGLAWFLLAHVLTATIIPLELVFEHRNYFASLGVCLVLGDLLLAWPKHVVARGVGSTLATVLLLFYSGTTVVRAYEWRDPLVFAYAEAERHPQSPRATYALARELIIRTGYRADSAYVPAARRALLQAMQTPGASTLPEAAAILFEGRMRRPIPSVYWNRIEFKLRTQPVGVASTTSLASLVDCQIRGGCAFPQDALARCFTAALTRGPNPEVLNIDGNFLLNVVGDRQRALQLWSEAARRAPSVVQYQATMAKALIASGQRDQAEPYLQRIRALGPLGQNEALARQIEARAVQP